MRLIFLPLIFFCAIIILSLSESKFRIIHADLNLGRKVNNEQLRILKGSVHVLKDTINMYCDSAFYFESVNKLVLMSRVLVDNGHRKLRAKKIIYFPDDDLTECIGKVSVSGLKDSLFTHRLIYNLNTNEATATDSVYLWDKEQKAQITGKYGYYNEEKSYFRVKQNAHFSQIDTVESDTFNVEAAIIEYFGDTLQYTLAVDSVLMYQGDFKSLSDSAWYYQKTEIAWLRGKPTVWFENSELSGNIIKAKFDSTDLKNIYITGNAKTKTLNDTIKNEYNVLEGKIIEFFVQENKPHLIIARNNATSVYYLSEENDEGSNYSTSDSIYVFFKEGKLDSIEIIGGAQGIYFPDGYKGEKKVGK